MASLLIQNGADPLIKDRTGRNAYQIGEYLRGETFSAKLQLMHPKDRLREENHTGILEMYFDTSIKSEQQDVPFHNIATVLCPQLNTFILQSFEQVHVEQFRFLLYDGIVTITKSTDLIRVLEITCILSMKTLRNICLKKFESILDTCNFSEMYQCVYESDILSSDRITRQFFNAFHAQHIDEITPYKDRGISRSLISEDAPLLECDYSLEMKGFKRSLFKSGLYSDFTVIGNDKLPIPLHKCIIARVEYFALLFKYSTESTCTLQFSQQALTLCFEYIYEEYAYLTGSSFYTLFEVYTFAQFADRHSLTHLRSKALENLEMFGTPTMDDLCMVFVHEECEEAMKLKVEERLIRFMTKENVMESMSSMLQYGITRELSPKCWDKLEKHQVDVMEKLE
jgi:hypothetical protein